MVGSCPHGPALRALPTSSRSLSLTVQTLRAATEPLRIALEKLIVSSCPLSMAFQSLLNASDTLSISIQTLPKACEPLSIAIERLTIASLRR